MQNETKNPVTETCDITEKTDIILERLKGSKIAKYSKDYYGITIPRLFCELFVDKICFVIPSKMWYYNDTTHWIKDTGGLRAAELCKDFAMTLFTYAHSVGNDDLKELSKSLSNPGKRRSLLIDASSVAPVQQANLKTTHPIDMFMKSCTNTGSGAPWKRTPTNELIKAYNSWAKKYGYDQMGARKFVPELRVLGYNVKRESKGNVLIGYWFDSKF